MYIVVNTWVTKRTPWILRGSVERSVVEKLVEEVMELPTRVETPIYFSTLSLPRYYMVVFDESGIKDIVGVRIKLSNEKREVLLPTKWSYKIGYWHPWCQIAIAESLKLYLATK